eukprot:gene8005-biopygen16598
MKLSALVPGTRGHLLCPWAWELIIPSTSPCILVHSFLFLLGMLGTADTTTVAALNNKELEQKRKTALNNKLQRTIGHFAALTKWLPLRKHTGADSGSKPVFRHMTTGGTQTASRSAMSSCVAERMLDAVRGLVTDRTGFEWGCGRRALIEWEEVRRRGDGKLCVFARTPGALQSRLRNIVGYPILPPPPMQKNQQHPQQKKKTVDEDARGCRWNYELPSPGTKQMPTGAGNKCR